MNTKEWKKNNPHKIREYGQRYYRKHKTRLSVEHAVYNAANARGLSARALVRNLAFKESAINMYSNGDAACKRCGQSDIDVLCLDHILDDGYKHRSINSQCRGGAGFYRRLRKQDYPPGLQVLCANCNLKKEIERRRTQALANRGGKNE